MKAHDHSSQTVFSPRQSLFFTKEGVPLREINAKLDAAYNLARANIFKTKTPKFKALLAEWKRIYEDLPDDTGESGTGKPES
jgi:hypothetical protein